MALDDGSALCSHLSGLSHAVICITCFTYYLNHCPSIFIHLFVSYNCQYPLLSSFLDFFPAAIQYGLLHKGNQNFPLGIAEAKD